MVAAVRSDGGDIAQAARCRLALRGIKSPTPEQVAGAELEAWTMRDIQVLARGQNWKV